MMAFGFGLSLLTGLLFGLLPAISTATLPLQTLLGQSGTAKGTGLALWHHRGRSLVTVVQFALTLVLLIGAGLLVKSFWQIAHLDPGYDARHRLVAQLEMNLEVTIATPNPVQASIDRLMSGLRGLPGVRDVAAASSLPLASEPRFRYFTVEHRMTVPPGPPESLPFGWLPPPPPPVPASALGVFPPYFNAFNSQVSAGFFRTLGIRTIRGREFTDADVEGSLPVVVVNDALATRYWPDSDAVGKRLRLRPLDPWLTVVGVVGNVRRFARDDEMRSEFYLPLAQATSWALVGRQPETPGARNRIRVIARSNLVVFTEMRTEEISRAVRAALPSGVSVARLTTLQGMLDEAAAPRRFILQTFGMFAVAAFVLAGLGIFSVMHYLVSSSAREMGIRLALGATRTRIFCMVISRSLALSVAGVAIGLTAAWAASRRIDPTVYRVTPQDPLMFAAFAVALVLVSTLAGWIPAHQATRVDPLRSLRDD